MRNCVACVCVLCVDQEVRCAVKGRSCCRACLPHLAADAPALRYLRVTLPRRRAMQRGDKAVAYVAVRARARGRREGRRGENNVEQEDLQP